MGGFAPNRGPLVALAGLATLGALALGGLVTPLASDYLGAASAAGDRAILTTMPSLVRVRVVLPDTARLTVMRDGKLVTLLLELDPECPPPSGWV